MIVVLGGALEADSRLALDAASSSNLAPASKVVAHRPGGVATRLGAFRPRAFVSRTGLESGEPTIGVDDRGSVYTIAWESSVSIHVLRSSDRGRSWEDVSPKFAGDLNRHRLTFDPYIYLDPRTGRLFTIDLTVACSYLSYSDEDASNWTTNPLACGRPVNDHQTLFAGPPATSNLPDYPNVVYYCFNDALSANCSKSLDGGMTFTPTGSAAFPPSCGGLHGHGVVGSNGEVLLPMSRCDKPLLAISRDEGDSWRRVRVARNGSYPDPSVAVDAKGNIYYAWQATDRLPYLSISRNGGRSWSDPMMIGAPGVRAINLLTIDVARPGRVGIAYMGTRKANPTKMSWYGYVGMTRDIFRRRPVFYTADMNPSGRPFKKGGCGPLRCGEDILDFLDVEMGPDGMPWASFVDACIARCEVDQPPGDNEGVVGYLVDR